ncbi:MAG: LysR family transcriptional regulator [Mogibacterium sp.]|nr:LysR family transcriptional regulator [Mogibacterium sp.]
MDTSYIKEFVTLAECMSFSTASNILFISQSSLSKHIKTLEKELGVLLFDRTTRSIRLTEAGRTFMEYATQIADLYDKARITLEDMRTRSDSSLIIATMQNPQYYDMAKYVVSFKEEHPDIAFQVVETDELGLYELFRNGLVNAFPTFELFREEPEDYRFMPIVRSKIDVILRADHPKAGNATLSLKDLAGERLLLPARGTTLSRLILREFNRTGITPDIVYEGSSTGSVDLVKAGLGIAMHAEEYCRIVASDDRIVCIPVAPPIDFVYGLAYRDPALLSLAEQIFLSHMKKFELK